MDSDMSMRVLAVVPARAGSKRIPNKNMRLLFGRPLVAYAIDNALKSTLVTDVVVSTDSPQVALVAEQMGATVRMRPESLCADEVTLDPVIWDALEHAGGEPYDLVVTLQPTSPALLPDTLDKAIEDLSRRGLDTLISVRCQPMLAWEQDEKGELFPAYERRENSQQLPPYWCETGSFLISRPETMSKESRVGGSVGIFEVSADEAISVRSFQDLVLAREALRDLSVAIYVHGNRSIGTGHVFRILELVDEFYASPTIYFDSNKTDRSVFRDTGYKLVEVDGDEGLFAALRNNPVTLFVNDILSTSVEYMSGLRAALPKAKIVNFEDEGPGANLADLVFNALLEQSNNRNVRLGSAYYLAPKTFLVYQPIKIRDKVQDVLVTFGGADPAGYTDEVLSIIDQHANRFGDVMFHVVLGPAKASVADLEHYDALPNVEILRNIDNMPQIMSKVDVAIASRGRTCYELAVMGIPTISIAENEREETHSFVSHENGFHYLGRQPSRKMIESSLELFVDLGREERQSIQDKLLSTDLRNGRQRVMGLIHSL